jgi:hypothetical protein
MDASRSFRRALGRRFASALGVTLAAVPVAHAAGCGGDVVVDGPPGGGGGGAGSTTSATSTNVTTSITVSNVTVGPSVVSSTSSVMTSTATGGCTETTTGVNGGGIYQASFCVDTPDGMCPATPEEAIAAINEILANTSGCDSVSTLDCGPFIGSSGVCCYVASVFQCDIGRPFVVAGASITASADGPASDWLDASIKPDVTGLDAATRAALADRWAEDAALEHASIASFSRFALDLMAMGAPSDLVEAAHRAALDEVRHARMSFAIASAYRGAPVAPSAFPFGGKVDLARDLAAIAAATATEGCIGETLSAVIAAEQLAAATDPAVRRALEAIAEDEARHAELAWRTVAWAIEAGGDCVLVAVEAAFEAAVHRLPSPPRRDPSLSADALRAHGRIDGPAVRMLCAQALDDVVLPCARALIEARSVAPASVRGRAALRGVGDASRLPS